MKIISKEKYQAINTEKVTIMCCRNMFPYWKSNVPASTNANIISTRNASKAILYCFVCATVISLYMINFTSFCQLVLYFYIATTFHTWDLCEFPSLSANRSPIIIHALTEFRQNHHIICLRHLNDLSFSDEARPLSKCLCYIIRSDRPQTDILDQSVIFQWINDSFILWHLAEERHVIYKINYNIFKEIIAMGLWDINLWCERLCVCVRSII